MQSIVVSQAIRATQDAVFETVASPDRYAEAVPAILRTEFLTSHTSGVGTRFRSVRQFEGKETTTELEIVDVVPGKRVRMVSESNGTTWDTTYFVQPQSIGVMLTMSMEAHSKSIIQMVMNYFIRSTMAAALHNDLVAVKTYCEGGKSS